jgi:hypothetical protein
MGPRANVVTGK